MKSADTWTQFATQLECCIAAIEEDDILIVTRQDANQFVQLIRHDDVLSVEATSNAFIQPPPFLLDQRHYAVALQLGWLPPTEAAHDALQKEADDEPYEGSPNFHLQWPVGRPGLAKLFVDTLRRVYGIRSLGGLMYTSFKREGFIEIRWPTLGVPSYAHNFFGQETTDD